MAAASKGRRGRVAKARLAPMKYAHNEFDFRPLPTVECCRLVGTGLSDTPCRRRGTHQPTHDGFPCAITHITRQKHVIASTGPHDWIDQRSPGR